jgi:hypothetical protein
MTGAWNETELTGKRQKLRVEANQVAIVTGDGRCQIVINQLASNSTQTVEGVDMASDEGFEALAVSKLDIHHSAMTLDQGEGVQLAGIALVMERSEVAPVDFETIAGQGFHAHERARC